MISGDGRIDIFSETTYLQSILYTGQRAATLYNMYTC